jgi:hypothetical protein
VARLNKLSTVNGFTFCVQFGSPRRVLRMRSSWSPLLGLSVYQSSAGNWSVSIAFLTHPSSQLPSSQKCSVCDIREGACVQCSKNSCFLAYHVTCARKEKLLMPMKASSGLEPPPLQCFCERHMPVCRNLCSPKLLLSSPQA